MNFRCVLSIEHIVWWVVWEYVELCVIMLRCVKVECESFESWMWVLDSLSMVPWFYHCWLCCLMVLVSKLSTGRHYWMTLYIGQWWLLIWWEVVVVVSGFWHQFDGVVSWAPVLRLLLEGCGGRLVDFLRMSHFPCLQSQLVYIDRESYVSSLIIWNWFFSI